MQQVALYCVQFGCGVRWLSLRVTHNSMWSQRMMVWCVYSSPSRRVNTIILVTKSFHEEKKSHGGIAQKVVQMNSPTSCMNQPADSAVLSSDFSHINNTHCTCCRLCFFYSICKMCLQLNTNLLFEIILRSKRKYTDVSYLLFIFGRFCSFPKDTVEVGFSPGGQVLS